MDPLSEKGHPILDRPAMLWDEKSDHSLCAADADRPKAVQLSRYCRIPMGWRRHFLAIDGLASPSSSG
jgi:hypothetical protein